ncbi:MAG TPA: class I SAM-dependent methyltransferase [Anaerolineales bacterium]|nr:class I SAM-dependent methyltransferase [Anaerolineales bacterium]
MPDHPDLARLRTEYADRARRLAGSDRYSPFNPAHRFALQQRRWDTLDLLHRSGLRSLTGLRLLEIGCGAGGVLIEYLDHGVAPRDLHGVDLLPDRLSEARRRLPAAPLACADGRRLPYPNAAFDLVLQYTAFSSILDDAVKSAVAAEMLRVLKPAGARRRGGVIVWYDFWLNPTNPQARGIRPAEIRRLFPGCTYTFRRITLAPPIARRLVPRSRMLAVLLERLKIFNSHYVGIIRPFF